jgi:CHASE2 domain-containing sensor protein
LCGTKPRSHWREVATVLLASLAVAGAIAGARSMGLLQAWELKAFDWLVRMQPQEQTDQRLTIVTVGEEDIQYQDRQGMERKGSLSDRALERLLEKIEPEQPSVIGVDIYHDFAFKPSLAAKVKLNKHFIAPCEVGQTSDAPLGIAAPPDIPPEQTGFTDLPRDPDDVMRRQLLLMTASPSCNSSQSLSFRIALDYLAQQGIVPERRTKRDDIRLGNVTLKRFVSDAGGYQLPPADALGYQILIRYRAARFTQVSLRDILSNAIASQLPDLVKGRIILIGVSQNAQDAHLTPYSYGAWREKIPGVLVHAHSISQIIAAVEDGRALLWWWDREMEIFWIVIWSVAGGTAAWFARQPYYLVMFLASELGLLSAIGYVLLMQGGWIPLVPPGLALIITAIAVANIKFIGQYVW